MAGEVKGCAMVAHFTDYAHEKCELRGPGLRKPDTHGLYLQSEQYLIGQNGPFSRKQRARLRAGEVLKERRLRLPHLDDKDGVASFSYFKRGSGSDQ